MKKKALEELFDTENESTVVEVITHELDLYFSQLKIPITGDPLLWWKNRANVFPYLSCPAKKYLCVDEDFEGFTDDDLEMGLSMNEKGAEAGVDRQWKWTPKDDNKQRFEIELMENDDMIEDYASPITSR